LRGRKYYAPANWEVLKPPNFASAPGQRIFSNENFIRYFIPSATARARGERSISPSLSRISSPTHAVRHTFTAGSPFFPLFLNFPHRQLCFVRRRDFAPSVIIQFICAGQKLGQVRAGILALLFGAKILYYKFARWKKERESEKRSSGTIWRMENRYLAG